MKVRIQGESTFVNRWFRSCGPYQWARELLQNSLEAGATRVNFDIEWQAVGKHAVYRRMISDNGAGMDPAELQNFFSTLGAGSKKIGGLHENFGIGGKISTLPWNPLGMVVISRKKFKDSMIKIFLDESTGDYELLAFDTEEGKACVIDPNEFQWPATDIDWGSVMPSWIGESGTTIVLLGSEDAKDTIRGNVSEGNEVLLGLTPYLNTRFWSTNGVDIRVTELWNANKEDWPNSPSNQADSKRHHHRNVKGAQYFLKDIEVEGGRLAAEGEIVLAGGKIKATYFLWEGNRSQVSYAQNSGYIAVKYKNELFEMTNSRAMFRTFGIVDKQIQSRLTIILEPQQYNPGVSSWGVHPDDTRTLLRFTGQKAKGIALPLGDWGQEFAERMPEPILAAIRSARKDIEATFESDEYRKRLQGKFGNRWKMATYVEAVPTDTDTFAAKPIDEDVNSFPTKIDDVRQASESAAPSKPNSFLLKKRDKNLFGEETAKEKDSPVDVPKFRLESKDVFDKPWHIAMWVPNDPDGPTVMINCEAEAIEEVIKFHQEKYAPVFAEDVQRIVLGSYGEIAACKIAHSQKLRSKISREELDRDFRSPEALTMALLGLIAEESVISSRLAGLVRQRKLDANASSV